MYPDVNFSKFNSIPLSIKLTDTPDTEEGKEKLLKETPEANTTF